MAYLFYTAGLVLAGYAGYQHLGWYFIFIASTLLAIGWFILRAPNVYVFIRRAGIIKLPGLIIMQIALMAIISAPIYFIATLF